MLFSGAWQLADLKDIPPVQTHQPRVFKLATCCACFTILKKYSSLFPFFFSLLFAISLLSFVVSHFQMEALPATLCFARYFVVILPTAHERDFCFLERIFCQTDAVCSTLCVSFSHEKKGGGSQTWSPG